IQIQYLLKDVLIYDVSHNESRVEVRFDTHDIPKRDNFKCFGSLIQDNTKVDDDATHRTVPCDKNAPPNLKGKFYGVVVRPTMLYETEY
ncbi:hypothetical protein H5410_035764, partial [Solanum commersonii]